MNNDSRPEDSQNRRSTVFRRSVMVMVMVAVVGYVVAFVQAERGTVHYNAYVGAYTTCYQSIAEAGAAVADCNYAPEVRQHLLAHRDAIAIGEPFFNLALALTVAVVLSPLIRRFGRRLVSR